MEQYQCPSTVEEILNWKCEMCDSNWPESVEKFQEKYTMSCGGEDVTDVLYSFLGIYAIGVWVFNCKKLNSDMFKIDKNRIRVKNEDGKYQYLWSKEFLLKIQKRKINGIDVSELNKCIESFAKHYFKVGNLIPLWPGGNKAKGDQNKGYMDIPELFFTKYYKWFVLLKKYDNSFLEEFDIFMKENNECLYSLKDFLKYIGTEENYKMYIHHIVDVIKVRTDKISVRSETTQKVK